MGGGSISWSNPERRRGLTAELSSDSVTPPHRSVGLHGLSGEASGHLLISRVFSNLQGSTILLRRSWRRWQQTGFQVAETAARRQASCPAISRGRERRGRDKERNQQCNTDCWGTADHSSKAKWSVTRPGTGSALSRCGWWEVKVKKLGEPTPPHHLLSAGMEPVTAAEPKQSLSSKLWSHRDDAPLPVPLEQALPTLLLTETLARSPKPQLSMKRHLFPIWGHLFIDLKKQK